MGRLTGRDENGNVYSREEAWILNANGVINKDEMYKIMMHLAEKLAEYEDLEEQGKLLKLPCAVGDTVYIIDDIDNEPERMSAVTEISIEDGNEVYIMISDGFQSGSSSSFGVDDFGKTVFLTKEAAEATLKEMSE